MTMPRYAARRDSNDSDLAEYARAIGWFLYKTDEPGDYIGLWRAKWEIIEMKNPNCEGHADEYTAKQQMFHADAKKRNGKILIWRCKEDIDRDSGARRTA